MTSLRAVASALVASALVACSSERPSPAVPEPAIAPIPADAGAEPNDGSEPEVERGALSTKESKVVARTLLRVSQLRGVLASRPVPGVKLGRTELVDRVKQKARREYPEDVLRREGQLLQLFGFAPPSFDYFGEMMKLLEAQLEGFYEPNNGTMYLAADLKGREAQATLAHELVHALQDQNWDLKSRSSYRPGKGDETLALACLAEGDATSLMMDFIMADQGMTALELPEPAMRELMQSGMNTGASKSVPHILRSTLVAPYVEGLAFVQTLRRKGGWPAVDRAWATPPTTTEQVLHVDKWEQHEPALTVPAPTANALGADWTKVDEDTFGELGFALAYEEWTDPKNARLAAAGWGGDRSAIYTKGSEIAFAVHERYDAAPGRADAFAERAITSLGPALKKRLGPPAIDTSTALCFERADLGPILLARSGRELVIAIGPAQNQGTTWTSTSTCAKTKRWADEILAQR